MISAIICGLGIGALAVSIGVIIGMKIADRIEDEEWRH